MHIKCILNGNICWILVKIAFKKNTHLTCQHTLLMSRSVKIYFFPHTSSWHSYMIHKKSWNVAPKKNLIHGEKNHRDWYLSEMFKLCLLGWGSGFSGMECHRTQPAQTNDGLTPTFLPCPTVLPTPVLDAQFSFWQTDGRSCSCWQQPRTLAAAVDHDEPVSTSKRTPSLQFIFKSDFIAQTL